MTKIKTLKSPHRLFFFCPGCQGDHCVGIAGNEPGPIWTYNGNPDAPTFMPSVLVQYNGKDADQPGRPSAVCHSFVTDGRIQFLNDSTHKLAGQTVDLPDFEREQA